VSHTELIEITKGYPVAGEKITAVNNVSLVIEKGDFISIAGHSGSGKTTLISIIGGILSPGSGKVVFNGTDICSLNDDKLSEYRNSKIGFIFQFASLLPNLTAKENVLLPCIFSRENALHRDSHAKECLENVGIGDKINAYPSQLSGGEQRRVAIARAFINSPELILADEPTGDLDEVTEHDIMELFRKANNEQGTTFVIVTHSSDIANSCRKKYRMSRGILTQET
jgi:putative ABC transport system ATP-binding protein/lipoprotein-releasing system ATP-binding protein